MRHRARSTYNTGLVQRVGGVLRHLARIFFFFFAVKKVSHPLFSVHCSRAIKMWGLRGCRGRTPYRGMRRSFGRIRRRKEVRQIARSSLIRFDPTIYCTSNRCVLRSFFLMLRSAQCTHPTNSTRHIIRYRPVTGSDDIHSTNSTDTG